MSEVSEELRDPAAERIELYLPKWVEMLPEENEMKQSLILLVRDALAAKQGGEEAQEQAALSDRLKELPFLLSVTEEHQREEGKAPADRLQLTFREEPYYEMLSKMAGVPIRGEYQLMSLIRELSQQRAEYETVHQALESVRQTGYGVIAPKREEIAWEEPVLTHNGNRFGIRLKAVSPSIHLLKADIASEIAPIVGTEQQAKELIAYLQDGEKEGNGVREISIFGKSVEQLMEDGIASRLAQFDEKQRQKVQQVIGRILDENSHGMICIII